MIGAIIGDIIGSRFEFNNIKIKQFNLFDEECCPTDDSIMTLAVDDICRDNLYLKNSSIINTMKKWGRLYPNAGYGWYFYNWVLGDDILPYNSCGNGSAMRTSAVGWFANTEEEVIDMATRISSVTHNHPEGIKGAIVTAMMIFKARHGATKEELYNYAVSQYPEIKRLTYKELVLTYIHDEETCQKTLPQALFCFLISKNFEDCVRTTISIGGDCDTTAAISCAIAEAFYKDIPENIINGVLKILDKEQKSSIKKTYLKLCDTINIGRECSYVKALIK